MDIAIFPLLKGLSLTFIITATTCFFGIFFGSLLTIVTISKNSLLTSIGKAYVNLIRTIPLVVVLLGFFLVLPNFFGSHNRLMTALLAFIFFETAYFSEIIRAGISVIPEEQLLAGRALGLKKSQVFRCILLPQAILKMMPVVLLQGIIIFQDTSLVYMIGLNDFFTASYNQGQVTGELTQYMLIAGLVYLVPSFLTGRCIKRWS